MYIDFLNLDYLDVHTQMYIVWGNIFVTHVNNFQTTHQIVIIDPKLYCSPTRKVTQVKNNSFFAFFGLIGLTQVRFLTEKVLQVQLPGRPLDYAIFAPREIRRAGTRATIHHTKVPLAEHTFLFKQQTFTQLRKLLITCNPINFENMQPCRKTFQPAYNFQEAGEHAKVITSIFSELFLIAS